MRAAYFNQKILAIFGLLLFSLSGLAQEYSAGINTENPNTNAVLHLVAPNGDQGLLIPTLTGPERTTMGAGLAVADNGMLVYDSDDGLFYYWLNPTWIALTTTDNDNQTLTIAGTNLTISNGNTVDIGVAETDPTVPATIKDGIDWLEISGIPAGFADGTDDGGINTVSVDGSTITGDGAGVPLAVGSLPAGQISGLATIATTGSFADLTLVPVGLGDGDDVGVADGTTVIGDGIGTPYAVNVGTGANQIVQLDGTGALPAVDGSNLTGISPALAFGSVTTTEILDGTIANIDIGDVDWAKITGVPAGFADGTDDVGLTNVTSADIVDNEIANIDINATANIASTKLENTVMVEGENVSLLNNDLGFIGAGSNITVLTNDAGYLAAVNSDATLNGDGTGGTPLAVNVGTGPNQLVQLNGTSQLPAVDGSLLTNVNASTLAVDAVTSAAIANGTIVDIDVSGTANIAATKLQSTVMVETENVSLLTNDAGYLVSGDNISTLTNDAGYLATVTSDATLNGDGTGGTPLTVNAGVGANQIVQLNASAQLPAVDGSLLTNVVATSLAANSVGTAEIADGSIADVDVGAVGWAKLTGVPAGFADNTDNGLTAVNVDGTTVLGDGAGTALSVNVGNGANQLVQLNASSQIPAIDGSLLTNVAAATVANNAVGSAQIVDGSIVDLDVGAVGWAKLTGVPAGFADNTDDGMLATTYDPNTIAGDAFDFDTHPTVTTPINGYVLTFTAGSWDALPNGLTLPFTQSVADASDLIYLTNTGTGGAGAFEINNVVNASSALNATTNGIGAALRVSHGGTAGPGMDLSLSGATNTSPGILVSHSGAGAGLNVALANATNPDPGISVNHAGLGPGIEITTTTGPPMFITGGNAGEVLTSDGLGNLTLQPGGLTLPYLQTVTDAGDLFHLINDGTGGAGAFQIANATNAATALNANTNGTGSVILASHTGLSGTGVDIAMSNAGNPSAGITVNHAGTGTGIEVTTASGPNITLNGATPFYIPTGAGLGNVLTSDATGNAMWAQPLMLPYTNSVADPGTLFTIANTGAGAAADFTASGIAAYFTSTSSTSAIQVNGDIEFLDGGTRNVGILANLAGAGDILNIVSGSAAGPGGDGGNLNLRSGSASGVGNGGTISIEPGAGAGGGNFGGVFVNGITRFGNQEVGFGGMIELEDDAGTSSIGIEADPATASYIIRLPAAQGAGALTNDGAGALTWVNSANAFVLDGNNNLIALSGATPPGTENFLVGVNSGNSLIAGGSQNTLIGNGAGQSITGGQTNVVIGVNAGGAGLTTGNGNVILGQSATVSENTSPHVVIGQGASSAGIVSVSLGSSASVGGATTGSMALGTSSNATGDNSIALGYNTNAPLDNSAVIGNVAIPDFHVGIGTETPAAKLSIDRTSGSGDGLSVRNNGTTGRGITIDMVAASANPDAALLVAQNADGMGADIRITNSVSASTALSVSTQGDGNVAFFNQAKTTSGADAMFVQNLGLAGAGVFQVNNTGNTAPALSSNTNGTGRAAQFVINSATNTAAAVYASTNGTGNALLVDHVGTTSGDALAVNHSATAATGRGIIVDMNGNGNQGLFIGGTNPLSSSIETDGDVLFRANLITPPLNHDAAAVTTIPSDTRIVKISNAGPDISQIAPGIEGQEIMLIVDAGVPGFNIITGGNLRLDNNGSHPMLPGASIHFVFIETLNQWVEISRSR